MNYLWSPWRMEYIESTEPKNGCIFCLEPQKTDGDENLIVYRGRHAYVILNRYPYTSGHLMVVPFAHKGSLELLDAETRSELMELVTRSIEVLRSVYHPDAFNMGANIGEAAGAGVAEHVHLHVVPRWSADTNFMSTVGATRVLPEDLSATYHRIRDAWGS
ncbi:MAG: HIT domain-containing protein [Chloroflexi bacterium]|nr:HIT domain-containing protein [Chloroflexota bacterium]